MKWRTDHVARHRSLRKGSYPVNFLVARKLDLDEFLKAGCRPVDPISNRHLMGRHGLRMAVVERHMIRNDLAKRWIRI